jgi:hypothetical protein
MRCEICGVDPCQTLGFCQSCRDKERALRQANGVTAISMNDFYLHSEQHKYIYLPTGALWPAASLDERLPWTGKKKPSKTISKTQAVEQMTWFPGQPTMIHDKLLLEGGLIEKQGVLIYNNYRPPDIQLGDAGDVAPFIEHAKYIYPDNFEWIIRWGAYRYQHPDIKINHALVLGGIQGVGKDTLLAPIRIALGHWNCRSLSPAQLMGQFNGYRKSVLLYISEARDLGDVKRTDFYDHTKDLIVSPPETFLCNEKNTHEYQIPNLCGVVLTTNYKAGGIHLPSDDRRHYVCWSNRTLDDFDAEHFDKVWKFYNNGGYQNVAAYLAGLDVSGFDPFKPPPKTEAWHQMVNSSRAPEFADMADALDKLGSPTAVAVQQILNAKSVDESFKYWLTEPRNRTRHARRFEECGYVAVPNNDAKDKLWPILGRRQIAYALELYSFSERVEAVQRLPSAPPTAEENWTRGQGSKAKWD